MNRSMTGLMMLVGGGVLGAGLGLLFAPCAGEKSRKKMMRMGKTISNRSDRVMRDISDRLDDLADSMSSMSGKAGRFMHLR
ncbi:YtxH domain-containing protein [Geomonas subterranea]|uniref:YtxH domain-containing protein n=2 Tax=Geomonas subterranea TaxID=2847989 RepID=A0ABX8LNH1_9BACT|nr:YtxH domain-containing protein [Geomonas subterranea]QXM11699.1 YtxH domain-containing protein [Geomonas subterranea]